MTDLKITKFLQGYLDNEVNLNSESSCSGTCTDHKSTKNYGCYADTLCSKKPEARCNGTVYDCEPLDDELTVSLVYNHLISILLEILK